MYDLTEKKYIFVKYWLILDTCVQTIVPLVEKFCAKALKAEDETLPLVATQLGKVCHGIAGQFIIISLEAVIFYIWVFFHQPLL